MQNCLENFYKYNKINQWLKLLICISQVVALVIYKEILWDLMHLQAEVSSLMSLLKGKFPAKQIHFY
jgi:hypothetical protein